MTAPTPPNDAAAEPSAEAPVAPMVAGLIPLAPLGGEALGVCDADGNCA